MRFNLTYEASFMVRVQKARAPSTIRDLQGIPPAVKAALGDKHGSGLQHTGRGKLVLIPLLALHTH